MRVLGRDSRSEPLVAKALETAAEADSAAHRARAAVDSYWRARRAADRAGDALAVDEYARADAARDK